MKRALVLASVVALSACAPAHVRPSSLADAAVAAQSPASREAAELAPTSFQEAEWYRRDAQKAYDAGDSFAAQILGERAIAAYARAFADARTVKATRALEQASSDLARVDADLANVREEETRTAAEVATLEGKIKVVKDAPQLRAVADADPARERARAEAAKSIATEAKLLCVATRLVAPGADALKSAEASVTEADEALAPHPAPKTPPKPGETAIELAMRARSACLAALSTARRSATAKADDPSDALLAELAKEGSFAVTRDDRGVVVTLERPFQGDALSKNAEGELDRLAKVAAAHADVPLLVVVHDEGSADAKRDEKRAAAAKKALAKKPDTKIDVALAGNAKPVVDPKGKDKARNERLEVVFVDRGS